MELIPRTDGEQELVLENRDEIDLARFALHARANRLHFRPKLRSEMFHTAAVMAGVLRAQDSQNETFLADSLTLAPDETERTIDALQRLATDSKAPDDLVDDVSIAFNSLRVRAK